MALVENQTGKKVKVIRSDNGGEYSSQEFMQYCVSRGIKREFTVPMTPQQKGVSKRINHKIIEATRYKWYHAKLPLNFWAEAVSTADYQQNLSPTVLIIGKTPYECLYSVKPTVNHLKVFGCHAYVHIPDQKRR